MKKQQDFSLLLIFGLLLMFMLVLVMKLGHMGMRMRLCFVCVLVTVFLCDFDAVMLVMSVVMTVTVFMGFLHVDMRMLMFLRDCEISSDEHDGQSGEEGTGYRIPKHDPGNQNTNERRSCVIDTRSCCSKFSLGSDIKEDTETVGDKAQKQRQQYVWQAAVAPIHPYGDQESAGSGAKAL